MTTATNDNRDYKDCKNKQLLTTKEAANYLGIEYNYFRKCRNKGYFGRDKYPAPPFINIGNAEKGIRYRVPDLDEWLANYPSYTFPAQFFKVTGGQSMSKIKRSQQ